MSLHVDGGWFASKPSCSGTTGYTDITQGAQVRVRNEKGKVLGVGALGAGKPDPESVSTFQGQELLSVCKFAFAVKGVGDAKFYSVEVAHRGEITYSAKQLAKKHWKVALTLGD
jgi:hypothetical protein